MTLRTNIFRPQNPFVFITYLNEGITNRRLVWYSALIGIFLFLIPFQSVYSLGFIFNDIVNISNTPDDFSDNEKIAISGNKVFVVWHDSNSLNADIFFSKSDDGGITFSFPINLSNNTGNSSNNQIAVSGDDVYVVWADNTNGPTEIFWSRSTDGGTTFNGSLDPNTPGAPIDLSNSLVDSDKPQIAILGSAVFLTWIEDAGNIGEIYYTKSSDSGENFGTPINLSNTTTGLSKEPKIFASANTVAVVWTDDQDGNQEIFFSKSLDSGDTFNGSIDPNFPGTPINLSNSTGLSQLPQIGMSATNLSIVWEDSSSGNDEIMYLGSTDGGVTFNTINLGNPTNLSNSTGFSGGPYLVVSDSNVYVAWQDDSSGNLDVLFRSSSNNGETFANKLNLSNNSGDSVFPHISASGTEVYVVWQDFSPINEEVFFKASSDNGSNFGGLINLSNDSFDSGNDAELAISGDEVFVAWPNDSPTGFDIFYRQGSQSSIDIVYDSSEYKLTDSAGITTTAPDYNLDNSSVDSITVKISSSTDAAGMDLVLLETGVDSGIFAGSHNFTTGPSTTPSLQASVGDTIIASFGGQVGSASIFPRSVSFALNGYNVNSVVSLTVFDQNSNSDDSTIENIDVPVTSTSDSSGILVNLVESGKDTGLFTGTFSLTTGKSSGNFLKVAEGDTILASFLGATDTTLVIPGFVPGGSGGGLVINPGLVLDLLGYKPLFSLSQVNSTNTNQPIQPSTDPSIDFPFKIDGDGFILPAYSSTIATRTKTVGEPINVQLVIDDVHEIQHVALYTDLRGDEREISNSDTYIIFESANPPQIVDPHGFFADVKVTFAKNENRNLINFVIIFTKPMDKSDIIIRVWDSIRSTSDAKILEAWQIIKSPNLNLEPLILEPERSQNQTAQKDNFKNDKNHLLEMWVGSSQEPISDANFLQSFDIQGEHAPSWLKQNAKWTLSKEISLEEFEDALHFLRNVGILK